MQNISNYLKSFLILLGIFCLSIISYSQCITPVITSISNTSPVLAGGNIILSAKGTVGGMSSTSIRMAGIGSNAGNQAFNQVFSSGDRPGSIDRISNAQFDAIFTSQATYSDKANVLKAKYDVLMFTWSSPNDPNINWPLVTAYLNAGGSVFLDGDYNNVTNLYDGTSSSVVGIHDDGSSNCGYTIVSPAPFPALVANGINGCFVNNHLSISSFPSWMAAYITVGAKSLAVAGIYPNGNHGRLIVQGPDQDFHADRGAGGTAGNQYQIILNQLDFMSANQAGITWTGPNGFTSNDANPVITGVTAAQAGVYTATLTNTTGGGCFTTSTTTVIVNSPPVITCPANINMVNDPGKCGANVSFSATATDGASISYSIASGSFFATGTTNVTATATNSYGTSTCNFTVTVSDNEAPIFNTISAVTVSCGTSLLPGNIGTPTASDNCTTSGNIIFTYTDDKTLTLCGGIIIRSWTATDESKNQTTATQTINVSAAALPTMTAPAAITVACGGLPISSTISFSNGLTAGCLDSGTSDNSTFSTIPSACGGMVTETWTATDICGRTIAAVSRIITVSPAALPTMTVPAAATISLACGASPIPSKLSFTNGLAGGCLINGTSNVSTFVTTAGTCGGSLTEIWTATDVCGRQLSSVSRAVTIDQNLGAVQNFVLFSGIGAVSNTGNSAVTGDVGSNLGAVSGFGSPTTITGGVYSGTANTTQAKLDLMNLYIHLSNIPVTNTTHAAVFGSNETIGAGVYTIGAAASMAGNLNLDAQGNAHAIFVLKFNGAFSASAGSSIALVNGASAANVFWIAEGAISIGATSTMKGTFIAHTGAVTMAAGGNLEGRLLSTVNAVNFGSGIAKLPTDTSFIPVICVNTCNNPILGSAVNFTLFTIGGGVSFKGSAGIIGNIGSGSGSIKSFDTPASTLIGSSFSANTATTQAANDLMAGYNTLVSTTTTNGTHAPAFGNETLTPGVYAISTDGTLSGTIVLDGKGNSNAQFIFKFAGAFSVAAQSKMILVNGTSHCNVYWIAENGISFGNFSFVKGVFIANNSSNRMGANCNLEGNLFSTGGSIGFNSSVAYISYLNCINTPAISNSVREQQIVNTDILKSNISTENKLSVYPNPAKGIINLAVTGDANKVTSVEILNVLGKVVYSSKHYQSNINLSNQAAGIYFVRVQFGSSISTTKIVMEK